MAMIDQLRADQREALGEYREPLAKMLEALLADWPPEGERFTRQQMEPLLATAFLGGLTAGILGERAKWEKAFREVVK